MEQTIIIQGVPAEQFKQALADLITEKVSEAVNQIRRQDLQERFLSPSEVCKLFQPAISKPTLTSWSDKGHLTRHVIGSRTYYKESEVIAAVKSLKRYKTPLS